MLSEKSDPLLAINNLETVFHTDRGLVRAVDGLSLRVSPGETLGVVGESGCGKSVTALSVLRLLPRPAGRIAGGEVLWEGRDLAVCTEKEMRAIRGNRISMIFQEPMTSLNPVFSVGAQIAEPLRRHRRLARREAKERAVAMLDVVGIPSASARARDYPHQFSGGQRQRIMIAMALACRPALLIADEPTTALDVTVQEQILSLMDDLKNEFGSAVMLITHSLGVVARAAQRVLVLYAGRVAEEAPVRALFNNPLHPYTRGLLASMPGKAPPGMRLPAIPGLVPSPLHFLAGCRFHDRCPDCLARCSREAPPLFSMRGGHAVRCWLYESERCAGEKAP